MILNNCKLCNSNNILQMYTPRNSKINLKIFICKNCNIVFGNYDNNVINNSNTFFKNKVVSKDDKFIKLSCDADYSEVRVGKQQMVPNAIETIKHIKEPIHRVLDICCAKGHFAESAINFFNLNTIDCIDNDEYMTSKIKNNKIKIFNGQYFNFKVHEKYDLIHCCHILEHENKPLRMIEFMSEHLKDNGYLYIDVPNLKSIDTEINFDEFFYDKHLFYFDENTLINLVVKYNFELIINNSKINTINLLFKKTNKVPNIIKNVNNNNFKLLENYSLNIQKNFFNIKQYTNKINYKIKNKRTMFFGCGRLFDTFVTYGGLLLDDNCVLVDDFICNATDTLYSKKIHKFDNKLLENIDIIILFIKTNKSKIIKNINFENVVSFDDIIFS